MDDDDAWDEEWWDDIAAYVCDDSRDDEADDCMNCGYCDWCIERSMDAAE
jgi:hypothetical protein